MVITREKKSMIFLILIVLIFIAMSLTIYFSLQTNSVLDELNNDQLLKTLIVVHDDSEIVLTDVLFYYPLSRRAALVSIPGYTGAIFSSLNRVDRIDSVFYEKGLETYHQEIEKMIGTKIPFSMSMSLENFSILCDYLGGLKVFIPNPIDVLNNDVRYLLPSGSISLDGDKLQTYLKYNLENEDENDVMQRKQNVFLAFLIALNDKREEICKKTVFKKIYPLIDFSLDEEDSLYLFNELSFIDGERLSPQTVTGNIRVVDGEKLLFPYYDGELIKDVTKQTMSALVASSEMSYTRTYVLEIQNGTTVQGLARNTAALLKNIGYDVLSMVNADSNDYEKTIIIDHIGNEEIAKNLADFIHCDNIITEEIDTDDTQLEDTSLVDFTIILGKDFDGRYVR